MSVHLEPEAMKYLTEYAVGRDNKEFDLGDTLDVKTGIIAVALTFLAVQSGELIKPDMTISGVIAQTISLVFLALGGICCVAELWPRDYDREPSPEKYQDWMVKATEFRSKNPECEPITSEKLTTVRLERAISRIRTNLALNTRKSSYMFGAFVCLAVSFGANLFTLITHLF